MVIPLSDRDAKMVVGRRMFSFSFRLVKDAAW